MDGGGWADDWCSGYTSRLSREIEVREWVDDLGGDGGGCEHYESVRAMFVDLYRAGLLLFSGTLSASINVWCALAPLRLKCTDGACPWPSVICWIGVVHFKRAAERTASSSIMLDVNDG